MKLTRTDIGLTLVYWLSMLLAVAMVGGCHQLPPVDPQPVPPSSSFDCSSACARLRALGCKAAENTAGGATCEEVCENVQSSGFVSWDLECRSQAASCEAVELCEH